VVTSGGDALFESNCCVQFHGHVCNYFFSEAVRVLVAMAASKRSQTSGSWTWQTPRLRRIRLILGGLAADLQVDKKYGALRRKG